MFKQIKQTLKLIIRINTSIHTIKSLLCDDLPVFADVEPYHYNHEVIFILVNQISVIR